MIALIIVGAAWWFVAMLVLGVAVGRVIRAGNEHMDGEP